MSAFGAGGQAALAAHWIAAPKALGEAAPAANYITAFQTLIVLLAELVISTVHHKDGRFLGLPLPTTIQAAIWWSAHGIRHSTPVPQLPVVGGALAVNDLCVH